MGFLTLVNYLWVFFLIAGIVVLIIWLVVMNKALDQVSHDLRKMEPSAVWLCFIPLFGLVWQFLVAGAVGESIAKELLARGMFPKEEKPAYGYGLTGCILTSCCVIPYVGVCFGIIGLILLVVHAVKISEYNTVLRESGRWEAHYNARMNAVRGQMNAHGQENNPYPDYPPSPYQVVPPHHPVMPPPPAPPQYAPPPEPSKYTGKDRPENPFG